MLVLTLDTVNTANLMAQTALTSFSLPSYELVILLLHWPLHGQEAIQILELDRRSWEAEHRANCLACLYPLIKWKCTTLSVSFRATVPYTSSGHQTLSAVGQLTSLRCLFKAILSRLGLTKTSSSTFKAKFLMFLLSHQIILLQPNPVQHRWGRKQCPF